MGIRWEDRGQKRKRLEPIPEPAMTPLLGLIVAIALIASAASLTMLYLLAISD